MTPDITILDHGKPLHTVTGATCKVPGCGVRVWPAKFLKAHMLEVHSGAPAVNPMRQHNTANARAFKARAKRRISGDARKAFSVHRTFLTSGLRNFKDKGDDGTA